MNMLFTFAHLSIHPPIQDFNFLQSSIRFSIIKYFHYLKFGQLKPVQEFNNKILVNFEILMHNELR